MNNYYDFNCIVVLPNGKSIYLMIQQDTTILQLKNLILKSAMGGVDIQFGNNTVVDKFLLSLSESSTHLIKAVNWTRISNIDTIKQKFPNGLINSIVRNSNGVITNSNINSILKFYVILQATPSPILLNQLNNTTNRSNRSLSNAGANNTSTNMLINNFNKQFEQHQQNQKILLKYDKYGNNIKENTGGNGIEVSVSMNNAPRPTLRKSTSGSNLQEYLQNKTYFNEINNNSNSNGNSNGSGNVNTSPNKNYSYTPMPNQPGQLIYQPSTGFNNNISGGSKSSLIYRPKSPALPKRSDSVLPPPNKSMNTNFNSNTSTPLISISPNIETSSPVIIPTLNTKKMNDFLNLELLEQKLEEIPDQNAHNQNNNPPLLRQRSSSFSVGIPTFSNILSLHHHNQQNSNNNSNNNYNNMSSNTTPITPSSSSNNTNGNNTNSYNTYSIFPISPRLQLRPESITPSFTSFKRQSLCDPIIHSGELYKKNRKMSIVGGNWKKGYFILTSQKLIYSDSQTDRPKRELLLSDFILNVIGDPSNKYYCFSLVTNSTLNSNSYIFGAEDEDTRRDWIIAIKIASSTLNTSIDTVGLEIIPIPVIKPIDEIGYYKKLPSEIKVNHLTNEINLFRSKMLKLFKLTNQLTFKPESHLYSEYHNPNYQNTQYSKPIKLLQNSKNQNENQQNQVLSVSLISNSNNNSNSSCTFIKLIIIHNNLKIKFQVNINSTIESVLNTRPDLFNSTPLNFGLVILGSEEYIFNHKIKLSEIQYIQKCLRFKKTAKFSTIDYSNFTKIFQANQMNQREWKDFQGKMSVFEDMDLTTGYLIRSGKALPHGVEKTKLVMNIVTLLNIKPLISRYYPANQITKIPVFVEIQVLYGEDTLAKSRTTALPLPCEWNEQLYFDINLVDFPKECIFLVSIFIKPLPNEQLLLAQYPHQFLTFDNKKVLSSEFDINLLPVPTNKPILIDNSNNNNNLLDFVNNPLNPHLSRVPNMINDSLILKVKLPNFPNQSVYFEDPEVQKSNYSNPMIPTEKEKSFIENLLRCPRSHPNESEKSILWKYRYYIREQFPNILPTLLYRFSLLTLNSKIETYELLRDWPTIGPSYGLELLSMDFIDEKIRDKGVESINQWNDSELSLYLPQIVQAIKYEPSHYSSLVCFLIKRSLCNPYKIGQPVFWLCSSEIVYEFPKLYHHVIRYKLIMEALLEGLSLTLPSPTSTNLPLGQSLLHQYLMIQILKQINLDIIREPDKQQIILEARLKALPKKFTLPTHPLNEFNSFIIEECKVKDSNAAPLWLVFSSVHQNADPIKIIFKKDDVRPDELCLQIFSLMDKILKSNQIDCNFTIFKCMSVGPGLGLIEVVPNSVTLADFMRDQVKYPSIEQWLKQKNPGDNQHVDIFLRSCAAYSVATFILGIYDRHNDNLMVSETGHFFHIDFGYFLGKATKFFMFERETTPFVLTKNIVQMLGNKEREFRDLCCQVYNILRNNSRELLNLISMNIKTLGQQGFDLVKDRLKLELTSEEADIYFTSLIKASKSNIRAELNNVIHVMVHSQK